MVALTGSPEEILAKVQAIVEQAVPGVVCELQEYKTTIGCGALNEKGLLYDVKFSVRKLTEWHVEEGARTLVSKVEPRRNLTRRL